MPLLEVRDLRTHFASNQGTVRAVDGVTFDLGAGETLGIVGESGCGKSVTALSLMGLISEPPGSVTGSVTFDGRDILQMGRRELRKIRGHSLAMIFQDPMSSLNPLLTVGRQVSEPLQVHLGMDAASARQRSIELLELVGIPSPRKRLKDNPHQFSGGMRQRVMIAMALACQPKVVLADEITTALDVTIQAQILDLLKKLTAEFNTGFILITHDLGIVASMTQRVQVMYAGQIVESAETWDLFANPKMPYTWGLLRSIPRLDRPATKSLIPIEGTPPDLSAVPKGCRFAPRCRYRRPICEENPPDLLDVPDVGGPHQARCWGTQDVPGGGWLVGKDEVSAP